MNYKSRKARRLLLAGAWTMLVALAASAAGCDMCDMGAVRCAGYMAQECDEDYNWQNRQDCALSGQACSTNPADCFGLVGVACCI